MKETYGNDSITKLRGADRVRTRPNALLGSNGLDGAKQTVLEIVGNATDERLSGYGSKLDIALYEDDSISVRDYGRGVPLGWNAKENEWNYVLIYEDLYAGAKYNDKEIQTLLHKINTEGNWADFKITDYSYMISIGLNGLGAAASQYASEHFEVTSYKDGKASTMKYEKGKHSLDELIVEDSSEPNGTFIHWKPDDTVFLDTHIPAKWFEKLCQNLSFVAGFDVTFNNKGTLKEYKHRTIEDVVKDATGYCVKGTNFTHVEDLAGDICLCSAEVALGPSGKGTAFFHNMLEVSGGVHYGAYNMALYDFFRQIGSENGIKLRESDYAGKFSIVCTVLSNKMSVRGQTKDSLDDTFVYNCLHDCILDMLQKEYAKGTSWVMDIIGAVIQDAKNRIAVSELSKSLKSIETTTKKHKVSDKFRTCESYENGDVEETEVYIVEGDSAGGGVKVARDPRYQCYLAIRGKSRNLFKSTIDQIIKNGEIRDIIALLGCGVDLGLDEYESFDISKLKVGKIIFLADADIDGKHITMLLFVLFFKLFPELLRQGKVYVVDTPLYSLMTKDNERIYCMTYEEAIEKKNELEAKGNFHSMFRFKGLGEMDAELLWDTVLDPSKRHLRQIKIDTGDVEIYEVLEVLFGKSTERRKRAILGSILGTDFDETVSMNESISDYIDRLDLSQLNVETLEY